MDFKVLEDNPALVIGGVVLLLVLFSLRGGGGGVGVNPNTMVQAQLKAQETSSKTDVALAGINADQAKARTSALADVYKSSIVSRAQVTSTKDTNAARVALGMAGYQVQQNSIAAQERVSTAAIVSNHDIAAAQLNGQIQMVQDSNNLKHYQLEMTSANLPQILHSQEVNYATSAQNAQALASITSQQNQAITALQTEAGRTQASAGAQTSSSNNALGWVSTIASLFL
jgi:hypothetical protein